LLYNILKDSHSPPCEPIMKQAEMNIEDYGMPI